MEEEEDTAAIQLELKGAFRFYDKEGKINSEQSKSKAKLIIFQEMVS